MCMAINHIPFNTQWKQPVPRPGTASYQSQIRLVRASIDSGFIVTICSPLFASFSCRALGSFLLRLCAVRFAFRPGLCLPLFHSPPAILAFLLMRICVFAFAFCRICISLLRLRQSGAKKKKNLPGRFCFILLHSIINEILHFTLFTLVTLLPLIPFAICCSPLFGFASWSSASAFLGPVPAPASAFASLSPSARLSASWAALRRSA